MENRILTRSGLFIAVLAAVVWLASPGHAAEEGRVELDADKISFEESTGIATAEGNVRINNGDVRLFAPYVEYDSNGQNVRALSSPEGSVTFISAGRKLNGERLDYNIETGTGRLTQPNGRVESFYVRGEVIEVKPAKGRPVSGDSGGEFGDLEALWLDASLTTCSEPHPHYRLESSRVSVIPGRRVVIKQPRVYLGETLLFKYPFDYFVMLDSHSRRRTQPLFPRVGYESDKGAGLGLSGGWGWETGMLNLDVIGWSENIWEGDALLTQDLWGGLSAYARMLRSYDDDRRETRWRPSWGLEYNNAGWRAEVGWKERELVSIEKSSGVDEKYVLWRKPEFNIVSPWFDDPAVGGFFRLMATWGRYEESASENRSPVERAGAGVQIYGEPGSRTAMFRPFYNATYWHYSYDGDVSAEQRLVDVAAGVKWGFGALDFESAYVRRWSWGDSPMAWDDYDEREEVYQEIGYRIPTKREDTSWRLGLRGAYSIIDEELAEMVYKMEYDMHCMLWEAVFRDDLKADDDWFGLKLTIKAFPDSGVRLSGNDIFEPAKTP
ncbi:MAG: hypothetical protein LBQ56_06255, partial [Synergistaceae bacterium]|nr:hypothetical protein [Synergistaceae bacterium]